MMLKRKKSLQSFRESSKPRRCEILREKRAGLEKLLLATNILEDRRLMQQDFKELLKFVIQVFGGTSFKSLGFCSLNVVPNSTSSRRPAAQSSFVESCSRSQKRGSE